MSWLQGKILGEKWKSTTPEEKEPFDKEDGGLLSLLLLRYPPALQGITVLLAGCTAEGRIQQVWGPRNRHFCLRCLHSFTSWHSAAACFLRGFAFEGSADEVHYTDIFR